MRRFISLLLIPALILGGLWVGGESLLARQLRNLTQAGPGFSAASVTPLRQIDAIGVGLRDAWVQTTIGVLDVPSARLRVAPLHPLRAHLDLPTMVALDLGRGPLPLELTAPRVNARFLALSGLIPGDAQLSFGPMRLDDTPLAEAVGVNARLVTQADASTQTAYDLDMQLDGLNPAALPALQRMARAFDLTGPLSLNGRGRIWLDRQPTPMAMAAMTPRLAGLRIVQGDIAMGGISARLIAEIGADDQGRATGAMVIYTRDATRMLDAAAKAGVVPERALKLANTMIRSLSNMPVPQGNSAPDGIPVSFPEPQDGELRLPVLFSDGRMSLGPIPLGPAPLLTP